MKSILHQMAVLRFSWSNSPTKVLPVVKFKFDKTSRNNECLHGYYIVHEQI